MPFHSVQSQFHGLDDTRESSGKAHDKNFFLIPDDDAWISRKMKSLVIFLHGAMHFQLSPGLK